MALYRKFRPDSFKSIKGQSNIIDILKLSIAKNKISHAYLFSGTRGVGKTTTARVFAKSINCLNPIDGEACNKCELCKSFISGTNVDLIEIDAASNRGIDDIRDIKEKVNFVPTMSRYKVYIIDEVHMLTKDAFNALLKTLEEPPKQVVFILATTEIFKVPLTIISRCQRYDFKNADSSEVSKLIKEISSKEDITIDKETIDLIVDLAEGSYRDGLSIFEKLTSSTKAITYESAIEILGVPNKKLITEIFKDIKSGDWQSALRRVSEAAGMGIDPYQMNKYILKYLEDRVLDAASEKSLHSNILSFEEVLNYIKIFLKVEIDIKVSSLPLLILENTIINLCLDQKPLKGLKKEIPDNVEQVNQDIPISILPTRKEKILKTEVKSPQKETRKEFTSDPNIKITIKDVIIKWPTIITELAPFNPHLTSFMSKSLPIGIDGNHLCLEVKYAFHKDSIEGEKSRKAIGDSFVKHFGVRLLPKCILNPNLDLKSAGNKIKFEKKDEIVDNVASNVEPLPNITPEVIDEAMKIFEME